MAMKTFRPLTPGRRTMSVSDFSNLERDTKKIPKALLKGLRKSGGRNATGRTTNFNKSGGAKRKYRIVEFKRNRVGIPAKVAGLFYDPNRSARLALLHYANGVKTFILAPQGLAKGDTVECGPQADIKPGNALPLENIPAGTIIHAIEMQPGKGAQMVRSAGTSASLAGKEGGFAQVRMPSGELRRVPLKCYATIGTVSNPEHEGRVIGKAGRSRWLGRRPTVRGVAMNPVDHPHGGGEGRTSGGRHPVTPWGKPTKGYKTRKNKRTNFWILKRRPKNKKKN